MTTFSYEATNQNGASVKGSVQATSKKDALAQLRNLGLFPTRILEKKPSRASTHRIQQPVDQSEPEPASHRSQTRENLMDELKRVSEETGDDRFFTRKEVRYLPEILRPDERPLAMTSGILDGNSWLITLTNKRIIFLDKGMLYGLRQTIMSLDRIHAVSASTGILFGNIGIQDGASEKVITSVAKRSVKLFTNKVQDAIDALKSSRAPAPPLQQAPKKLDQIERLASMRDRGILTDAEFEQEKRNLLDG